MSLSVQVVKSNRPHVPVRDVRIDYSKRWQHQHWVSIVSAYKSSPYFDFYGEAFEPFYQRRYDFLVDYDLDLCRTVMQVLGMPEVRIPLAQAAIYVACAPKSNAAYLAIDAALDEVKNGPRRDVPPHLRSSIKNEGYKYAHDYPNHYVEQQYMPMPKKFYKPTLMGKEKTIKERQENLRKKK